MNDRTPSLLVMPLVAGLSLLADQVTKQLVRTNLNLGESVDLAPWLGSVFHLTYVTNSGAVFGLFQGWGHVFIAIAMIVIVALIWYYFQVSDGHWPLQLALGLQLGGAIGNLVDRLRFGGSVTDFIDLDFWPLRRWAVFNIADASIVSGVVVLMVLMIWESWIEDQTDRQLATAADE